MNLFDNINNCRLFTTAHKEKIISMIKGDKIIDLLTYLPKKTNEIILVNNYLDILNQYHRENVQLILLIQITKITNINNKQLIIEGRCYNAPCKLLFFRVDRLLYSIYKVNEYVVVAGKVEIQNNIITMIHPVHKGKNLDNIPYYTIEINYCSNRTKNLFLKKKIYQLLDHLHQMELPDDWIPLKQRQEYNLPTWVDAIKSLHGYGVLDVVLIHNSYNRIILDEILYYHCIIGNYQSINHDNRTNKNIRKFIEEEVNDLVKQLQLPFVLKPQQYKALNTIFYDMDQKPPLFRLLQGDVGSGKTIVAVIAMAKILRQGYQGVILSPSLTLCQQHYEYFKKFLPQYNCYLVTSNTTSGIKGKELYENITNGNGQIIIGTQSLFSENINFKKLGLIIFDEHHKFGVLQRSQLAENFNGHILSMTATPSPRTMMMAHYGFLDVTTITNEEQNRCTYSLDLSKLDKILQKISLWIQQGEKIYWVCPKITQGSSSGISCIERYNSIINLNINAGIIHGQMEPNVIQNTLEDFKQNKIKILVSTTVIEVGIDINDATIMIIENGEMFGISQLHQLRGRVGRGHLPGKCLIIYNNERLESIEKIEKFVTMESGFEISNLDLSLRGPGDLIGTHQKGKKTFKFVNKNTDKILFAMAKDIAPSIDNMDFIKKVLKIENEELFLKKN